MKHRRFLVLGVAVLACIGSLGVASDVVDRLSESAIVIDEILQIPDGIPRGLLDKAECVVVLPSVKKFAIGVGGSYGRGAMICRGGEDFTGPWGAPSMVRLEGGNIGFQLGGQATDFVFLIMNQKGVESLLKSKVKLGVDASAAAGPKGRTAGAATDALMRSELLTYSRSRGLFAGVSLEGSTLRPDAGANALLYGREVTVQEIVRDKKVEMPEGGEELAAILQKASPKNRSE
jgi:lipid-binding SYLF domain-containing protein